MRSKTILVVAMVAILLITNLCNATYKFIDLGTLGGDKSTAYSINESGQLVGRAMTTSGNYHATLFNPAGNGDNIDLNTLVDLPLGWTLEIATGINDNGWIVGYGINPDGYKRAFYLLLNRVRFYFSASVV